MDGYTTQILEDGYCYTRQLNIRITNEDLEAIKHINNTLFEGECTNSMLGRMLIRKGIQWYKNLK